MDNRSLNKDIFIKRYSSYNKYLNPNKEIDAFDLLFQEDKSPNIDNLRLAKKCLSDELNEKSFLRVYHVYFLIIFVLFIAGTSLVFGIMKNSPSNSSTSYLALEKGDNVSDDDTDIDYEKIESWVGSGGQKQEAVSKKHESKENSKRNKNSHASLIMQQRCKAISHLFPLFSDFPKAS